jgi:DNA repair protein NreA
MSSICKTHAVPKSRCNCDKHQFYLGKTIKLQNFSGSTPPEIFVGRWNYPNIYTGILSPNEHGNTQILSSPELWHKNKLPISNILGFRNQLIYGRTQSNIKKLQTKFLSVLKEIAMTHKSVSTSFSLKKQITRNLERESRVPIIPRAADLNSARLEENAPVKPKIDYLVNDTEVKSSIAIQELHKSKIPNSTINKILSSGLLGLKKNRRLVPTRWSITAVDDTISKAKLPKIKLLPEISEFKVFSANYVGNHYHFLLIPDKFSFEVIEISIKSPISETAVWTDHETFFKRKKYADSVTGAYYANRLALTEYLEKIKRQASCIVIREIRPQYYAPLGVGILRQISREAFSNKPNVFPTLQDSLSFIQTNLKQPISNYTTKSYILNNLGKQKKLQEFF